eukprot:3013356-Rhodomonas_salina.1
MSLLKNSVGHDQDLSRMCELSSSRHSHFPGDAGRWFPLRFAMPSADTAHCATRRVGLGGWCTLATYRPVHYFALLAVRCAALTEAVVLPVDVVVSAGIPGYLLLLHWLRFRIGQLHCLPACDYCRRVYCPIIRSMCNVRTNLPALAWRDVLRMEAEECVRVQGWGSEEGGGRGPGQLPRDHA